jgi:hypothetical protein
MFGVSTENHYKDVSIQGFSTKKNSTKELSKATYSIKIK